MIYLAETAAVVTEASVSGELLLKIIGAIFSGVLLLMGGRFIGKRESQEVTIKDQPVRFEKNQRPVSFDQHSALDARVARIENHLDRIERDGALQYKQILEAGGEREMRMTQFVGEGLREVHARLDTLLKISTPTRR